MFKTSWNHDLQAASSISGSDFFELDIPSSTTISRGLQPRSFELFLSGFNAGAMQSASSNWTTNAGIIANMIYSSQLTGPVVITSYDVNNSLFQFLMERYVASQSITEVYDEVYCPPAPAGTRLALLGLRTTASSSQHVKFSLPSTVTTMPETSGTFVAPAADGWVEINGAQNFWSTEIGYCYQTEADTLAAYSDWANNPTAPTMEWPPTIIRLTADGFIFEPTRQLAQWARPSIDVLPCQVDIIGYYQGLDASGAYCLAYGSKRRYTSNVKLNSFIDQDPVAPTSTTSDAYPFNAFDFVNGPDVKQHKPVVFGSCFDSAGQPRNYFVSGTAAQRVDRTDSTSAYPKQTDPDDYHDYALGWMMSPNQLLYWGVSGAGPELSGVPLANAVGTHGELIRSIPVPQAGNATTSTAKFGIKVSGTTSQGLTNAINFESSSVNGKLEIRAIGELDAILAIGSGLELGVYSGFVVAAGRNNKFGSVGWTN